mgnify:CR=1 FL=1
MCRCTAGNEVSDARATPTWTLSLATMQFASRISLMAEVVLKHWDDGRITGAKSICVRKLRLGESGSKAEELIGCFFEFRLRKV